MKELEEKFKNMHLLSREERIKLTNDLNSRKPEFLQPYTPRWWWWRRCLVKVLIVTDGGLNFGIGGFDLSEFLTSFNQLQATTWNNYEITLGHRGAIATSTNPLVVSQISNFNFQTSIPDLSVYDQVWLFGIVSGAGLPLAEKTVVENYMNGGGGLFATGDHGSLGSSLCGNITRVQDMRYWSDNPAGSSNDVNEVSMSGMRRNDTNRPRSGDATSLYFDNQSDNIPQTIAVRTFGSGMPHPLLSISTNIRPSGIIDIMPDHPHEGECKPATAFTVNSITVPTQIIATSFVLGGSTTGGGTGKAPTVPHCFPSIAVWDGRLANAGRIVVDSTWHHFVNINLNGVGSNGGDIAGLQSGLTTTDFNVIRQYFMNISLWISRRQSWLCWRRFIWIDLLRNSQLIEASLNNPDEKIENISLSDLNSIGALAEEILSSKFSPAFAREFLLDNFEAVNPNLAASLNIFKPENPETAKSQKVSYYQPWLNFDLVLYTSIGAGFIALRDINDTLADKKEDAEYNKLLVDTFNIGMQLGYKKSIDNFNATLTAFSRKNKIEIKDPKTK